MCYFAYQIELHLICIFLLISLNLILLEQTFSPLNFGYQTDETFPSSKQQLGAEPPQSVSSVSGYSSLESQISAEKVVNGGLCAIETLWEEWRRWRNRW